MKTYSAPVWILSVLTSLAVLSSVTAADRTWNGGGGDNFWSTPANWGGTVPAAGDSLFFGGSVRTSPANDFPAGTVFGSLNFNPSSSAFTVGGNRVTLDGGFITDRQALVPQTITLPLNLINAALSVEVVADGSLTLGGVISSSGVGLIKTGDGLLTLAAPNTFSGQVTVRGGTLSIAADNNLGVTPGSPAAGSIVLENGTLRTTSSFALNANRGITLTGGGTLRVNAGTTLTYGGVIANGTGSGLTKNGFGGLTLSGANTYTGPTALENGAITLDFAAASAPVNDIISSTSALTLGGENAGLGTLSFAAVTMNGRAAGANNSQSFNGTIVDLGPAIIRANSGSGGTANLSLGALGHNPGGVAVFVPPSATGGSGNITTPSPNVNGILGGWALFSDGSTPVGNVTIGQNWASVNGSGNIVSYSGYTDYAGGNLRATVPSTANLRLTSAGHPGGAAVAVRADDENAGTVTDINSIAVQTVVAGDTFVIGTGNTLRLGRFGGIFRQDSTTANTTWYIGGNAGTQTGNGTAGSQGIGTLTAGGADNTSGEIVFTINAPSQTQGSVVVEPTITDNGTGPVTVVKTGPGSMKLDGHNTFSGGLFILQGRLQFAGSEIGTPNPDGGGTGPIYVGPGGQFFPSGAATAAVPGAITNDLFLAGLGGGAFSSGALRMSTAPQTLAGQINLIGDVFICGGGNNANTFTNGQITGKITGNFSFGVGQSGGGENITTYFRIFNQENDYSGDTVISVRNGGAPLSTLVLGNSDVIPDGIGKGNLVLRPGTTTAATLDLWGFNETINGLSVGTPTVANAIIQNGLSGTTSTLTVGNYDASATFGGIIQNGAGGLGTVSLTKIGGGRQTLSGANTYTGATRIEGGTLALSGAGSIASSSSITVDGGNLDVSELTSGFSYGSAIDINNGGLVIRSTAAPGISALTLADSRVRVAGLGSVPVVADVATLNTGVGTTNYIDIASMGTVGSYPATFTIIQHTGIGGHGFNFVLGNVLTPSTKGYVTNNEANNSVDLVLLDGPKPLTWSGLLGPAWDIDTTMNWLAFGTTPSVYLDVDSAIFTDTGLSDTVNLTTTLQPGAVLVNNDTRTYTFSGAGKISGPASLAKDGPGTLIVANSGTNDHFGPTTITAGTVQVGNGGTVGNLSAGSAVNNDGRLLFNRSDDITVANTISGGGLLEHAGPGILTLAGNNSSFTGAVLVAQSTLKPLGANALGTADGATTVAEGATLDVNGQNLGAEPVIVAGAGVGGNGAIVNSGADQLNALRHVTLAGNVVFGGAARWDIRLAGGSASLSTSNQTVKITKIGPNQVSLVGVAVDGGLGEVEVMSGTFSLETTTSGLGDIFSTLTVHGGATLNFFNLNPNALNKIILLHDGANVSHGNGLSLVDGAITLDSSGTNTFNVAPGGGTTPSLVLNGALEGAATLVKIGAGPLVIGTFSDARTGPTLVNAGSLLVDGSVVSSPITVAAGATLGGAGSIHSPVLIQSNGRLSPGNLASAIANLTFENELTLQGTNVMDVNKSSGVISSDRILGFSTLTYGGTLQINPSGEPLANGDEIPLFSFGSVSGAFASIVPATPGPGLLWDTSGLLTDGTLRVVGFEIESITIEGSNVRFAGGGGTANAEFRVLSSTDLTVPVSSWPVIHTGTFDASGNFDFTLPLGTGPHRFYVLSY